MAVADFEAPSEAEIRERNADDAHSVLDEQAQRYLGISGQEFLRRRDEGCYDKDADRPEVMRVAMRLPFGR